MFQILLRWKCNLDFHAGLAKDFEEEGFQYEIITKKESVTTLSNQITRKKIQILGPMDAWSSREEYMCAAVRVAFCVMPSEVCGKDLAAVQNCRSSLSALIRNGNIRNACTARFMKKQTDIVGKEEVKVDTVGDSGGRAQDFIHGDVTAFCRATGNDPADVVQKWATVDREKKYFLLDHSALCGGLYVVRRDALARLTDFHRHLEAWVTEDVPDRISQTQVLVRGLDSGLIASMVEEGVGVQRMIFVGVELAVCSRTYLQISR